MMVTAALRRKAFRAALAVSDQSIRKWCKTHNMGHYHVGRVIAGKRQSRPVDAEVDSFIARTLLPFVKDYETRGRQ